MTEEQAIAQFTRNTAALVRTMPLQEACTHLRGLLALAPEESLHQLRSIYRDIRDRDAQLELLATEQGRLL